MLSDKIRLLEEAADRAKAAEQTLARVKDNTHARQEAARVVFEGVVVACKAEVDVAATDLGAALKDVDQYKAEVRGFIDDIMQTGRVRQ